MKDLLLLHGALGAESQFEQLKELFSDTFNVYTFDFHGHGSSEVDDTLSIDLFTVQLNRFLQDHNLTKPVVFGYSMGGYVALNLERVQPGSFEKIVTLGTKFGWNPESSKKESGYLNPDVILEKIPHYAKYLDGLHTGIGWRSLLQKTASMMLGLGDNPILTNEDLSSINCDVTLMLGGEDKMVSQEETRAIASRIDSATFELLEGVPHPIDKIDPHFLQKLLLQKFDL
jgi:pimeloyl-ACP methyl ester carboxylesterase